ncbi:MAG TPA: phosphate/phosphite/phosphonate ABC transporter substrate-binding protein [Ramlibacter sp.]|jgi:phosphate/phosphite/phosphonate ABC transporter binding protein|uniref:phosphate/phosphite/phosphonate ABC transporter substrate-binding protein n=1 Tax=Ramlibacter sp. TaxID=1917967 RepID=UPI002D31B46B|nr:phosphate/phosphite/phosphonate ABC transporter substrate-binding protein [Ramlibacter sp.]HZY17821.1 phosphate/phosphite/phosphonate ABC transporter substrate-binding protein [Ramlibacter sp.]
MKVVSSFVLLACAAAACGALAQGTTTPAPAGKGHGAGSQRFPMVLAMPKTYGKTETMGIWGGYFSHLSQCANVSLRNQLGESLDQSTNVDTLAEKDLIDVVRTGKAHLAQVNPGLVPQLVAAGQPAPFAVPGNKASSKPNSYHLILIARTDSPYRKPADLAGKKIAHTTPTSNSGNLAPRALFPAIGLVPEKNYEVVFSGGHERSAIGVMHGFYDGAAVASDLFQRMVVKGDVRMSSVRVLWESPPFMTESWIMTKEVPDDVQARVRSCTFSYQFSPNLKKLLPGNDVFLPVKYERDFATVLEVYNKSQAAAK